MMNINDASTSKASGSGTNSDDVDCNVEVTSSSTESEESSSSEEEYHYQVLSTSDIPQYMSEIIHEASYLLQLPPTKVRILLNYCKWDKDKLLENIFDGDQDQLFREANMTNPFTAKPKDSSKVNEECRICLTVCELAAMTGLDCNHTFCYECWNEYLTHEIVAQRVQTIVCPSPDCQILLDDNTVEKLVKDANVKASYKHLITNGFIESNRLTRWCPSPGCQYAIKVDSVLVKRVVCRCRHIFCFECGEDWHAPVKCSMVKKWMKIWNDDPEMSIWEDAKQCPKCGLINEKVCYCNCVVCENPICNAKFCWWCLSVWECEDDEAHQCNWCDKDNDSELSRYDLYYDRYRDHMISFRFERNVMYQLMQMKMREMQRHNVSWNEVQFLMRAMDILCECRLTLIYSYVFVHFLEENNQFLIFEQNLNELEMATELLGIYLYGNIALDAHIDSEQEVQDNYTYCDRRRRALVDHVHEGYAEDWWVFKEA